MKAICKSLKKVKEFVTTNSIKSLFHSTLFLIFREKKLKPFLKHFNFM